MAEVFGLPADVFYGHPDDELPDWRAYTAVEDEPEDDDEPSDDDMASVVAVLGFDPAELDAQSEVRPTRRLPINAGSPSLHGRTRQERSLKQMPEEIDLNEEEEAALEAAWEKLEQQEAQDTEEDEKPNDGDKQS